MIVNNQVKSNFDVYDHSLALAFYSNILHNVSNYSEFPIQRLIGCRGQAPPEVRRVATNEMDLKMFLTRYPSIFRVTENGCVRLVKTVADCRKTVEVKIKEETPSNSEKAVQFYVNVMKKKLSSGDKFLTLNSLIGHRNQAPLVVQNCAKNIDELYSFLSNHPKSFTMLPGKLVTLAKNEPSVTDAKKDSLKPKNNKNDCTLAVEYYSKILSTTGPNYSILSLIGHRGQAPPEVRRVAFTNRDLKSFLSRFPKIFSVTGNFVTLINISPDVVSHNKNCNLKSGTYPENSSADIAVQFYANILKEKGYCGIEFPIQKLTGYRNKAPLDVQNCARNPSELYTLFSNYPNVFTLKTKNSVILIESPCGDLGNKEQNLSLTSEVNCESTKAVEYYVNIIRLQTPNSDIPITSLMIYLNQAPLDVRNEARNKKELIKFFLKHPDIFVVVQNQYVKLADTQIQLNNTQQVQNTKLKSDGCIKNLIVDKMERTFRYFPTLGLWENPGFSGDWEHHVLDNTALITEEDECLEACEVIKKEKIIAFDCEGYNLGHGIISLIQIALINGTVYIFDIYGLPRMISLGLKEIIESDKILKVINHCRNDCLNLKMQYNVDLNYIFDVSIAYHVIENKIMSLSNFKPAGLNQMCEKYCVPTNSCKDDMKFVYITQPNYWLTRPLNIKMVSYAAFDVASLVPYLYCEFLKRMDHKTESAVWRLSQRMCIA